MNVISFLKSLAHAEKEQLLKSKQALHIGYDDNEAWVQSFYERGFTVKAARHQLNTSFFEHGETDSILTFLKRIQTLKIKRVIFLLPPNLNVSKKTATEINVKLGMLIKMTSRHKAMTIIEPTSQAYKSLMYIIKPFKPSQLGVVFNPSHIMKTHGSTLGQYRLLRKYITYFVCHDLTKDAKAALIGYGQTQIIALFKRLKKDGYKGDFILDPPFEQVLISANKRKKSIFKVFRKKELSKYEQLKSMMNMSSQEKDITLYDIYTHQYDVLDTIFRLR